MAFVWSPELRYNIASGELTGWVAGRRIQAQAGSGGRAGSKTAGSLNWWLANNPFAVSVKKTAHNPGGPLPLGRYRLVLHESRPNWIRLLPLPGHSMHRRDGFAIHGRGARGSDGCIVPTDFAVALELCTALRDLARAQREAPVLEVFAEGQDLDRQIRTA
jgi:hypothetical protein